MADLTLITCPDCHEDFVGESVFSLHRNGYGECKHPVAAGLQMAWKSGHIVWALPADADGQMHD